MSRKSTLSSGSDLPDADTVTQRKSKDSQAPERQEEGDSECSSPGSEEDDEQAEDEYERERMKGGIDILSGEVEKLRKDPECQSKFDQYSRGARSDQAKDETFDEDGDILQKVLREYQSRLLDALTEAGFTFQEYGSILTEVIEKEKSEWEKESQGRDP